VLVLGTSSTTHTNVSDIGTGAGPIILISRKAESYRDERSVVADIDDPASLNVLISIKQRIKRGQQPRNDKGRRVSEKDLSVIVYRFIRKNHVDTGLKKRR
jgi:hypothetical protein